MLTRASVASDMLRSVTQLRHIISLYFFGQTHSSRSDNFYISQALQHRRRAHER
jgi:hypothetical protein